MTSTPRSTGWLVPPGHHAVGVGLLLFAMVLLITGLVKLYDALRAFDEALSRKLWVSVFDDESEPDADVLVAEEEPA